MRLGRGWTVDAMLVTERHGKGKISHTGTVED
jgi:hypothetical protein